MAKKSKHKKTENNVWKYSALVLGVLLVLSVFTNGFRSTNINGVISDLNKLQSKEPASSVKSAISSAINSLEKAKQIVPVKTTGQNGKVVIEEFSDFECPFCGRAFPTVEQVLDEYGDQVEFVYKHFPLTSIHPRAQKAGEASECARDQDMFKEYHDKLYENQRALEVANLKQYAANLGLDTSKFNSCLDSDDKVSIVNNDLQEGRERGVSGTPTFFINGQKLVGAQPFSAFKAVIDAQLAGAQPTQPPQPAPTPAPTEVKGSVDDDPSKGSDDAQVVLIEWSDFQCPFCSRFYTETLPSIQSEYIDTGKVKLVYRDFPLSFHAEATPSAEASECADEQDMFWAFHDLLFDNQGSLSVANYKQWAADLDLDTTQFNDCVDSRKYQQEVQKDFSEGQQSGVSGTPGFVLGIVQEDGSVSGINIKGAQPYSVFKAAIDNQLAKVS